MSEPRKYRRQQHINAVLKNSGARYSAQAILMAMCSRSEFDAPTVTITKFQICLLIGGLNRKYILRGLRLLEETGVIEIIKNGQGGHGVAPTYRLKDRQAGRVQEVQAETTPERERVSQQVSADIMKKYGFG